MNTEAFTSKMISGICCKILQKRKPKRKRKSRMVTTAKAK